MSAAVGSNPFARTSGFTQTADQTKSVSGYYGNIDHQQEAERVSMRKSTGRDLNIRNPYVEKEVTVSNFSEITQRVVEACRQQQPATVLRGLRVFLNKIDKQHNGLLDPTEFKYGLAAYGIDLSEDELSCILKYFDTALCGKINLADMLHAMRSSSLNAERTAAVEAAYIKLSRASGKVTYADLEANFDVTPNPQFQNGSKTQAQLTAEFLAGWGTTERTCEITCADMIDFYMDVSPGIISDNVFANMIKNTWNL